VHPKSGRNTQHTQFVLKAECKQKKIRFFGPLISLISLRCHTIECLKDILIDLTDLADLTVL
jgi:hypothetical protein